MNDWRSLPRFWTQEKVFVLMSGIEQGWSDARIAKALGTSAEAVNIARKRRGIPSRTRTHMTARDVAKAMGFPCSKKVAWLVRNGFLAGRRSPHAQGRRGALIVTRLALLDFIEDDRTWHLWRWEDISDADLRRRAIAIRGEVRFLTIGEIADRYFVGMKTAWSWIAKGWIPARRVGRGNHVVDERVLAGFDPPGVGGNFAGRWSVARKTA